MSICQKKCSPRLPRFHFFRSTREIRSCRFETPAKIRTSRSRSRSMPSNQAILDLMPCDIPVAKLAWMEHGYSRDTYRMLGCSALKKHGHGQRPCACKAWRMLGRYGFLVIKRAKWPVHICAPPGPNNAHNTSGHHLDRFIYAYIYIVIISDLSVCEAKSRTRCSSMQFEQRSTIRGNQHLFWFHDKWNDVYTADITSTLTLHNIQVLGPFVSNIEHQSRSI